MIDARARAALEGVSRAVGRGLGATGVTPNMLTLAGLAITGVAAWRLWSGSLLVAGLILAAGGLFDFLDGAVAKATGRSTVFGAFLDSVTDRVSDNLVFGAIVWYELRADMPRPAALALGTMLAGNLVSYIRAKAESLGFDCRVGFMERAERVAVIVLGLLANRLEIALWVVAAASTVTVVQRLVHVGRQARAAVAVALDDG